jgi:peptide deformylase
VSIAVPRARSVRVECLNEKGDPITIHATGWYARILQHEIDHLHGRLYIDRAYLPTVMTDENYVKHWRGKSMQEIKASLVSQDSQEVVYAEFDSSGS